MRSTEGYRSTVLKFGRMIFHQNMKLTIGLTILLILVIITSLQDIISPGDPSISLKYPMGLSPSWDHPLGTDLLGRDIFDQVVHGIRQSLIIGFIAGTLGSIIGIIVGFTAGYKGGLIDAVLRAVTDIFLVIPTWPLLVLISSFLRVGLSIPQMAIIIAFFAWSGFARSVRGQVMSLRERPFVRLAKLSGENDFEIIFKELMPNMLSYLGSHFANAISGAMIAEVTLELVGLGPMNITTLGLILRQAQVSGALASGLWWWFLSPIAILVLIFIALHLVNVGLDEVYNPRLRQ